MNTKSIYLVLGSLVVSGLGYYYFVFRNSKFSTGTAANTSGTISRSTSIARASQAKPISADTAALIEEREAVNAAAPSRTKPNGGTDTRSTETFSGGRNQYYGLTIK